MLSGILAGTLVGNTLTGQAIIRADKKHLELNKNFDTGSSFNLFWKTKVLSKDT